MVAYAQPSGLPPRHIYLFGILLSSEIFWSYKSISSVLQDHEKLDLRSDLRSPPIIDLDHI